jgi:predicted Zn-dependent protease
MKNNFYSAFVTIKIILASLVLVGCAADPNKISDKEINAQALKAYNEMKQKSKISDNAEWTAMVNRVAKRIADASGKDYQWEVMLIENKEPNAWCMPGGKMAVYTGIMPVLKTEAALAAVMGHEVAHATHNHGKKRYARAMSNNMTGLVIAGAAAVGGALLCKTRECQQLASLGGIAAGFAMEFFSRKFDRGEESEADKSGQIYMAKAGYDPAEAIKVWERMGALSASKPPEWSSTHPSDTTRKTNLNAWLATAKRVYETAPVKYGIGEAIR